VASAVTFSLALLSAPLVALSSAPAADAAANAVIPTSPNPGTSPDVINNYQQVDFTANDDGTWPCGGTGNAPPACTGTHTGPELYPIGFNINFYGQEFGNAYINNNGNITFSAPLPQYTPSSLTTFGSPIIAPYFADVDTRGTNSAIVNFGTGTLNGAKVFVVNWPGVGCFNSISSVLNNAQLILIDRSDRGTGPTGDDFDMEFNYNSIQWDTGQASTGDPGCQNGQPGDSAFVGFSNGTSTAGDSFNLPGSGVSNSFLDSSTSTGLIYNSLNSTTLGRYLFTVSSGQPALPTTLTTSLSGGGHTGASISVPPGTAVTDNATVSNGSSSQNETGTVTYNVYSDSACSNVVQTGSAETITNPGTLPPSQPVSLPATGVYYWQAVYSGDSGNNGSVSACGSEVETVSGARASLKICKVAGSGVPVGTPVIFAVGNRHITVPAGPAPGGYCVLVPGSFTQGNQVTVTEQIPNTMSVTNIRSAPAGRLVTKSVPHGTVTVNLGSGVTETTFTDTVVRGTGYVEICNSAAAGTTGHYTFTYDGQAINVPVGACSPSVKVHAGALTIQEKPKANSTFSTCKVSPNGSRLLQCNQSTRTAVVAIVPGDLSTETIAKFLNT
jgi:Nidogen-like